MEEKENLCEKILFLTKSKCMAEVRYLSFCFDLVKNLKEKDELTSLSSDGTAIYYSPDILIAQYKENPNLVYHTFFHLLMHYILHHPYKQSVENRRLWDVSCDISVENVLFEMNVPLFSTGRDRDMAEWLERLNRAVEGHSAEDYYNYLVQNKLSSYQLQEVINTFKWCDHSMWSIYTYKGGYGKADQDEMPASEFSKSTIEKQKIEQEEEEWKEISNKIQTELDYFSRRFGKKSGSLVQNIKKNQIEELDYDEFLRQFGCNNEVMELSQDEFDTILYTYGLRKYGNIPLIEPLEFKDDNRISNFVIAIDTSGSVQGDIVDEFLKRTFQVLKQTATFSHEVQIYLIQCDAEIQSVELIKDLNNLQEYLDKMVLQGFGGTDFRPVFDFVHELLEKKELEKVDGLLYFTDGIGAYPEKDPGFKTAFIFNRDDQLSENVPEWAIQAILTTDNIKLLSKKEIL